MNSQTFILIGPSGSGKGTQATLLREHLEQRDPRSTTLYVQAGKQFRELAASGKHTGVLVQDYIEKGRLAPEFLTIWAWSHVLVDQFDGTEHLIFDGNPRRIGEAKMLEEALGFYRREQVKVILLEVSKEWSRMRLQTRGRKDDLHPADVERRLAWYDTDVVPVIDFFKAHERYEIIVVNGERNIEQVQRDVIATVSR